MRNNFNISFLEVGDIILEHTNFNPKEDKVSILSVLIRFFTNNYWNHAKYVVLDNKGRVVIQEALAQGIVQRTPQEALVGRDIIVMKPAQALNKVEKAYYCELAEELIGVKYDYFGTLLFQLIKQLTGIWLGSRDIKLNTPKYCSEAPITLHYFVKGIIKKPWGYAPSDIRNDNYFKPFWAGIIENV